MTGSNRIDRGVVISAWVAYLAIVFEILYMITPFALYYYSAYALPLRFLQSHRATAFLTMNILPHFSYQRSAVISALEWVSWPAVAVGILLFVFAFVQIYRAKFLQKGVVSGGLYRVIRHPQYAALALVGLGTTIYWPRFIVYLSYATMLFLYYSLAKSEEKRCLARYGEPYRQYCDRTGMFIPQRFERFLRKFHFRFPESGWRRAVAFVSTYVLYMLCVVVFGFAAREYAVDSLAASYTRDIAAVAVAPLDNEAFTQAVLLALESPEVKKMLGDQPLGKLLLYVAPGGWTLPELGLEGRNQEGNYLAHPGTHGNPLEPGMDSLIVLVTRPILTSPDACGRDILKECIDFVPLVRTTVDRRKGAVVAVNHATDRGPWRGIPVPVY